MISVLLSLGSLVLIGFGIHEVGWDLLLPTYPLMNGPLLISYVMSVVGLFMADDCDSDAPLYIAYVAVGINGLSAASHILCWAWNFVFADSSLNLFAMLFVLVPPILVIYTFVRSEYTLEDGFGYERGVSSTKQLFKSPFVIALSCVLALLLVMFYSSPSVTGSLSEEEESSLPLISLILGALFGVDREGEPPTFLNISDWSVRMKIILGVIAVTLLVSLINDFVSERSKKYIARRILVKTSVFCATVYVEILFFALRNNVLVHLSFLWALVEIVLGTVAGLLFTLFPLFMVFPNTMGAISNIVSPPKDYEAAERKQAASAEQQKKDIGSVYSVQSMPEVITGPLNEEYHRLSISAFSAVYVSEKGAHVTINDADIDLGPLGYRAKNEYGLFQW